MHSGGEKKAQGWVLLSRSEICESTAPTPASDTYTSTMNCLLGSGWMSTGALAKRDLSCLKAVLASGVQRKVVLVEVRAVKVMLFYCSCL